MYQIEFKCKVCNNPTIKSLPNKSSAIEDFKNGKRKAYCSKECKKQDYALLRKYKKCSNCNKKVRHFPNSDHKDITNIFCSNKCQGEFMKNNPDVFNLKDSTRLNKMQEARTEETWKKGIKTRKANGNIIDWDVAEWKQYWRRCNDLTRKMRVKLLGDWDGIDYIDGEDIRENLALPYTHADYPTLDHIIPRSEGFRQGLSPYEITTPENLKWTKRRNNSKKYNKKIG